MGMGASAAMHMYMRELGMIGYVTPGQGGSGEWPVPAAGSCGLGNSREDSTCRGPAARCIYSMGMKSGGPMAHGRDYGSAVQYI